jgi:aminoglycoside 6-adenylyltransferase
MQESRMSDPSDDRRAEVEDLLERMTVWAARRPDVVALALVGSYARDDAAAVSDVDLVLLTDDPASYTVDDEWIVDVGAARAFGPVPWGVVTERRLVLPSGLEVEVGVARPSWASNDPVDAGTRRVVRKGFRILYDPAGRLAALQEACDRPGGR